MSTVIKSYYIDQLYIVTDEYLKLILTILFKTDIDK